VPETRHPAGCHCRPCVAWRNAIRELAAGECGCDEAFAEPGPAGRAVGYCTRCQALEIVLMGEA
jgi:hypothetical protein